MPTRDRKAGLPPGDGVGDPRHHHLAAVTTWTSNQTAQANNRTETTSPPGRRVPGPAVPPMVAGFRATLRSCWMQETIIQDTHDRACQCLALTPLRHGGTMQRANEGRPA